MEIPQTILDISKYKNAPGIDIPQLLYAINDQINFSVAFLQHFYAKIVDLAKKDKSVIPRGYKRRYWATGTGILATNFSRLMRDSIEHLVAMVGEKGTFPYVRLKLQYESKFILCPTFEELCELLCNILNRMAEVGDSFEALESIFCEKVSGRYIPVYIQEEFLETAKNRGRASLTLLMEPIMVYIGALEEEYRPISDEYEKDEELKVDMTFQEGYTKISYFKTFITKVLGLVENEYFDVAMLQQEECKGSLKTYILALIDDIAGKLVLQHEWENRDICETFEMLAVRAKQIPKTTEELMEMGIYMTWANTELMTSLRERITISLEILSRLIEITTISPEHFQLNSETVNWLQVIKPILEYNSSMYEQYKFEYEERLQKAIDKLNADLLAFVPYLVVLDNMDDSENAREYVNHLGHLLVQIRDFDGQHAWINSEETTFKFPLSNFGELQEIKNYIYPFYRLVKVCLRWNRSYGAWMDGSFEFLDFETSEMQVDEYFKELIKTQKTYRNRLRQLAAEGNPRRFAGSVDDPDPLNTPAPLKLCQKVIQQIKEFRPNLTLMNIMCTKALLQRHWDEMTLIAGFDMTPNAGTTLRKIADMDLGPNIDNFEIISSGAVKELMLITNLTKMIAEWDDIKFKTGLFKETGITILTQLDDVQAILDDHIVKTLTMRGSVFVKPYEPQVKTWYEKITRINNTIDEWGKVQSTWLYLLPIFSSKDIVSQMPQEGILFKEVDGTYKRYMAIVARDPRVIETAGAAGLLEAMQNCNSLLEKINDGVTAYLEKKRLFFPRFFFLSNDEMLEILSETKDPLRVQPHLRKCFEAVNRLLFDDKLEISAMFSEEGEKIDFLEIISTEEARGSVERWLVQVEEQMVAAIKDQCYRSWLDYKTSLRTDWVQMWPGQIILAISQVYWTANVHLSLSPKPPFTLHEFSGQLKESLQEIVALVRNPNITNLTRITIKALIVIDVHAKDVVAELDAKNVQHDSEFKWLAQLRYYWEENDCLVRITNATVRYAYEYLGNSDRLVITPLTDRCYRTLVGAYHLHLNGAPEGPAGTGKTETTKDLAKALAVQCVVFNCSDGLDYKAMGKFFKGLASSGAWACFDEFNRIEIEVLSVVAQQILCIIQAVRGNVKKFIFEETELTLNPSCYVCITMNPGYAGRSELPDNLKVLFRTVAMMVPDYAMIGEISLYSYGFVDARTLSVKIVTTYRLCSEQLSSQNHYDYGMRAVKSVLSACGNNKRNFPDENEDILLLRSIMDVNLPKFLNQDVPLFEGIISDLFPGVVLPQSDYVVFIAAMKKSCGIRNLQPRESFIIKVIQTYEMMIVRHGFMIVGEPFAGKSSTLKVLADVLTFLNEQGYPQEKVKYQIINPKAITMGQLYGQFDPISYEWTDGVVATCFRNFVMERTPDRKWVIFDGPVDAVWIENMNTVLDDNKKLCLMSGEVMAMTNAMSMIFEVMDLAQASPATVSFSVFN